MAFPSLNGNAGINCPFSDTAICILIYIYMYVWSAHIHLDRSAKSTYIYIRPCVPVSWVSGRFGKADWLRYGTDNSCWTPLDWIQPNRHGDMWKPLNTYNTHIFGDEGLFTNDLMFTSRGFWPITRWIEPDLARQSPRWRVSRRVAGHLWGPECPGMMYQCTLW